MAQENLVKAQVLAEWDMINRQAQKRFGTTSLAEEAVLHVMDALAVNDWYRVKKYKGASSFKGFLRVLVARLLEDFSRKKFGRMRPPAWIRKLGGFWMQMFIALCQQRLTMMEAVEIVKSRRDGHPALETALLEDAGYTIREKIPQCGQHQYIEEEFSDDNPPQEELYGAVLENSLESREQKEIVSAIFRSVLGEEPGTDDELIKKLNLGNFNLSNEEKLLLKLHFRDNLNITEVGRLLSINRFQVHGRMRRLLKRLKREFDRVGLTDDLQILLGD